MSAVDSEAFLCFTLHQKNISPEHEQHKTIIMSKVTTCRFRFKFSLCAEICRHLAFGVLPVIIELAKNSQKSLMRWRGQLVIIAITRKYISYPFMKPKSTSLLRLASKRVLAKSGLAFIAYAYNWYSLTFQIHFQIQSSWLSRSPVCGSVECEASCWWWCWWLQKAFKSIQVGSNWLKLRFETYYKHL